MCVCLCVFFSRSLYCRFLMPCGSADRLSICNAAEMHVNFFVFVFAVANLTTRAAQARSQPAVRATLEESCATDRRPALFGVPVPTHVSTTFRGKYDQSPRVGLTIVRVSSVA